MEPNTDQGNSQASNQVNSEIGQAGSTGTPPLNSESTQSNSTKPSKGKSKTGLIIAALIVLIIVGAAAFVVMSKDKDSDSPKEVTRNDSSSTQDNDQDNSASSDTGSDVSTEAQTGEVAATISNFAFSPGSIKVKKGAKVTWTNQDSTSHTVTSDDDSEKSGLDSALLAKGETYSVTFDEVGNYSYHCQPHPSMTGTVEVVE